MANTPATVIPKSFPIPRTGEREPYWSFTIDWWLSELLRTRIGLTGHTFIQAPIEEPEGAANRSQIRTAQVTDGKASATEPKQHTQDL